MESRDHISSLFDGKVKLKIFVSVVIFSVYVFSIFYSHPAFIYSSIVLVIFWVIVILKTKNLGKKIKYLCYVILILMLPISFLISAGVFNYGIKILHKNTEWEMVSRIAEQNFNIDAYLWEGYGSNPRYYSNMLWKSPASSIYSEDRCDIMMNRYHTISTFKPVFSEIFSNQLVEGILMHELGHCIDVIRDIDFVNNKIVSQNALNPSDRKHDLSVLEYEKEKEKSTQWREVFADLSAIGFWQVEYKERASSLIDNLLIYRSNSVPEYIRFIYESFGVSRKLTHDTECWIKYSKTQRPLNDIENLVEWADRIREEAPCHLN